MAASAVLFDDRTSMQAKCLRRLPSMPLLNSDAYDGSPGQEIINAWVGENAHSAFAKSSARSVSKLGVGQRGIVAKLQPVRPTKRFMPSACRDSRRFFPPRQSPAAPRLFILGVSMLAAPACVLASPPTAAIIEPVPARVKHVVETPTSHLKPISLPPVEERPRYLIASPIPAEAPSVRTVAPEVQEPTAPSTIVAAGDRNRPATLRDQVAAAQKQAFSTQQPIVAATVQKILPTERVVQFQEPTDEQEAIDPAITADDFVDDEPAEDSPFDSSAEEVPAPVEVRSEPENFGLKPMSQVSIDIRATEGDGDFPQDVAHERFAAEPLIAGAEWVGRDWPLIDYRWEASRLCHGPVLFEQLNPERYGITYGCLQPVASAAHFFGTVPILPYKVWTQGHDHCQYALGYYRPGSYAVPQCYRPRISADASLFEAGVILGIIFALP